MFDFAVIGLGAAGSAALGTLARTGARVIGIDRFAPPHDQGSSHGETRLLRVAYAEGAQYVPMARRAIELWRALETRTGREIFRQTGVVYAGPAASPFLSASLDSARAHNVPLDDLTSEQRTELAGALHIPAEWICCAERDGGYLLVDDAIGTLLADARMYGAETRLDQACLAIEPDKDSVCIVTASGEIRAGKCVVTAGAWAAELLPALTGHLHVERRALHWFADPDGRYVQARFRPFLIDDESGRQFYGFPDCGTGVKIAEHTQPSPMHTRAADVARDIAAADTDAITELARRFCPALGPLMRSTTCLYPMSRDGHFIIDAYPETDRVFVAAGLSGHGFKFAPVIGEAVADLALGKNQAIDIAPFALRRET